jgi:hypothetical protein
VLPAERGGKSGKKRAIVATARKLAVLLHHLWVSGEAYEPLHNSGRTTEVVVLALGGSLAWMWFKRFPTAWGTVLLSVSFMLVIVVAAGIGYLAGIPFRWLLPRLLHRDLKANEEQLLYLLTLVLSIALIWGGMHWLSHKRTSTPATSPPSATLPVKP